MVKGAFVRAPKYEWTDDMDEISGFGGGYEQDCRDMLAAALAWLDAHPLFAPRYHSYENVVGILEEDDLSAEELSEVTAAAAKRGGATVAMHQIYYARVRPERALEDVRTALASEGPFRLIDRSSHGKARRRADLRLSIGTAFNQAGLRVGRRVGHSRRLSRCGSSRTGPVPPRARLRGPPFPSRRP